MDETTPAITDKSGMALLRKHRYAEALVAFTEATDADPYDAAAWAGRALALARLGHHQESLAASVRALDLTADQPNTSEVRRRALQALNTNELLLADARCYTEALALVQIELDYAPESALAWHNQGILLMALGKDEQALEAIEEALVLDDTLVPAWTAKGIALMRLRQPHKAIVAFDHALALHPGDFAAKAGKLEARKKWWSIFAIEAAPDIVMGLMEFLGHI